LKAFVTATLASKNLSADALTTIIAKYNLCETTKKVEVLMKRFETDFAKASSTICFQLTRVFLQYHDVKPVIHRSMFFPCR